MITWMQRHKKYLIITIWVSTIAFVGAGFVGWGQYSYGDKAGAIAKVENVEITQSQLQQTYSRLYSQYSQVFQGNFDEEKAKTFGLQKQALQQLIDEALILNLAASYDLQISDAELLDELKTAEQFSKDGVFDPQIYKAVLSQNNLDIKEYEADIKRKLLIQKTFKLLPTEVNENELLAFNTLVNIADKINYQVLSDEAIKIDTTDASLKPFWEKTQQNYMSEVTYEVKSVKQNKIVEQYNEAKIAEYYNQNKAIIKDKDGKILPLEEAKDIVIAQLNDKATKDMALKTYISYKKGKLEGDVGIQNVTLSDSKNPYDAETLEKIKKLSLTSPFLKPVFVNGDYYIFELTKINPSKVKSFEEAKEMVLPLFIAEQKTNQLLNKAKESLANFKGTTTEFITSADGAKLSGLNTEEAQEFLSQLFNQQSKKGYISLKNGKIVLFDILEQKLLSNQNGDQSNSVARLKSTMFSNGFIDNLRNKYKTETFIQGL